MSLAWQATAALAVLLVHVPPLIAQQEGRQLVFRGNIGFRTEYIGNENFASNDLTRDDDHRVRFRVRVRFGAEYSPSDKVTTGIRVTTGSGDFPSSHWSSLNDAFNRDPFRLDRAYIRVRPHDQLQLQFGVDANPLFRPTELVWDSDVSPGGIAEVVRVGDFELVAGQFMLREVRTSKPSNQENSFLLVHGVTYHGQGDTQVSAGAYHYYFTDPDDIALAVQSGELNSDFLTNRFDPADANRYFSDYNIVGFGLQVSRGDVTFAGDAIVNLDAKDGNATLGPQFADKENFGAAGIVTYGRLREPGDWSISVGFYHVPADAVVAVYNSDDINQTNVNTVPIVLRISLPEGVGLVWDTYIQTKENRNLASNGGVFHDENATKVRSRLSIQVNY